MTYRRSYVFYLVLFLIFATTGGFAYARTINKGASKSKDGAVPSREERRESRKDEEAESSNADDSENFNDSENYDNQLDAVDMEIPADAPSSESSSNYPLHKNISATLFWAGEEAGKDNKNISNLPSAWDEDWVRHFGGVDDPDKRNGYFPAKFTPKENPFYFALPYNDFDEKGKKKNEIYSLAGWSKDASASKNQSVCKNAWIKVMHEGKTAYAQWEDVGPFGEDDAEYVFGNSKPKSKTNKNAGLDLSPAVNDALGLDDIDTVDWQFVDAKDVPDGPWKKVVTTSGIYWK